MTGSSTLTEEVLASASACDDARLRFVFESLVRHLHAFVDEVGLTPAEWLAGVQFRSCASPGMVAWGIRSSPLAVSTRARHTHDCHHSFSER